MPSDTVRQLERAYQSGELDDLKATILPFIRNNRDRLAQFIRDFQRVEGPTPLEVMVKAFIIQNNMPFDMAGYMAKQSSAISQDIDHDARDLQRQACVAEWIRHKAEAHRSTSMFQQVFCFEKLKEVLLPLIEEELHLQDVAGR